MATCGGIDSIFRMMNLLANCHTLQPTATIAVPHHSPYYRRSAPCRDLAKIAIHHHTLYDHSCAPCRVRTFLHVRFRLPTSSVLFDSSRSVRITASHANFSLVSRRPFPSSTAFSCPHFYFRFDTPAFLYWSVAVGHLRCFLPPSPLHHFANVLSTRTAQYLVALF